MLQLNNIKNKNWQTNKKMFKGVLLFKDKEYIRCYLHRLFILKFGYKNLFFYSEPYQIRGYINVVSSI